MAQPDDFHAGQLPTLPTDSLVVPAAQRLDWVRSWLGGVYDFGPGSAPSTAAQDFRYRGTWWRHDKVVVGALEYDAHVSTRASRQLRSDQLDHYRLMLRLDGCVRCDHDGVRQIQQAGELLISDMSRPDTLDYDAGKGIALIVPREMLDEALPRAMDLHGAVPRGVAAGMLASHLRAMASASDGLNIAEAPGLAQATVSLLAAALQPSSHNMDRARPAVAATVLRQMCRYIDLHLDNSDLSADDLAAFFNLSRTTVYRCFEPLDGVTRYIKERRLARIHSLLADPNKRVHIGRVAEDHGFRSPTHFSRAFRDQYGYSPRDVRKGMRSGVGAIGIRPEANAAFDTWLRALRD
ncbi:helix-turn-helix domain-containing protein [Variovorax sp. KK3]|uniref:helix-turn-helix domain-containing protein n=1 Tax=Variovorax sp. KK3 TaxID=1855728 RepID=UPI00097BEDD3|nr:AraC family transcriptional regulator [Variovorax sp. KK3]